MREFDLPVTLTFHNNRDAAAYVDAMEQASEHVIWEQRSTENGTVLVTILSIEDLEHNVEGDDE